jgi:myo-inositol 2-dehydrogenase/D-chiro-inositol 1-dehydrogenase
VSRPPSVGLCGAGMISATHAAAAHALGWPVAWVASRTTESAKRRAARLGAAVLDYGDMPAGADLVIVSTPPADHLTRVRSLLAAGVAVVVEKPLCTTLAGADELVAAAERHHNRLLYAENLAYAPAVAAMVAAVGALGPLHHLEVRVVNPRPTWSDFLTDEWGGGALFDLGVHPIAVALLLAAPSTVTGVEASLDGGSDHGTDEHAEVRLHFDSGLAADVVASWRGGPRPLWDAEVASATGVLRAELFPRPSLERDGAPISTPVGDPRPLVDYGYIGQLHAFWADVEHGRAPLMDAMFGRSVLDVVCAAYTSAHNAGAMEPVPFRGRRDRTPLELWRDG